VAATGGAVVAMPLLHQHPAARAARAPAPLRMARYKRTSTLYRKTRVRPPMGATTTLSVSWTR